MDTKHADGNPNRKLSSITLVLLVLAIGLGVRLILAGQVRHPGHADYVFYYSVAENLVDGRGFEIDYIWHYLTRPEVITHSSNDYWMPLMSIIISIPMLIFGKSIFIGLLPSVFAGVLLAWVTHSLALEYTKSRVIALASLSLVLFLPPLFEHSLRTEGTIFYTLFVTSSLLFVIKSRRNPRFFLLAVIPAGLAQLTRQDGLLLVLILFGWLIFSPWPRRSKVMYALAGLLVYLAVLAPLMISNFNTFGSPFPSGTAKTVFLTEYEDLYSYSDDMTLDSYLESGFPNLFRAKIKMALANAYALYRSWGELLSIFVLVGTGIVLRRGEGRSEWAIWLPAVLFLGVLYAFYSVVIGFASSFERSSLAVAPFVIIFVVSTVRTLIPSRVSVAIIVLLAVSFFFQGVQRSRLNIRADARMDRELRDVKRFVSDDMGKQDQEVVVIMTRNPWEVYHSTRYKAIQIPNDELDVICEVARKYGANYLLLPGGREALRDLYMGERSDDRFPLVANIPNSYLKLFRISLDESR